jgi:hypothetical protein
LGSYILGIVAEKTSYHAMYLFGGLIVAWTAVIYYGLHHRRERLKASGIRQSRQNCAEKSGV